MMLTTVLDADQERAAAAPAAARLIVIAGPGAGKSEVVGERCRRLIEDDVYPEEILVISFSNAAVDVVRARTKDVLDEGRGVDCATIDSLASRVRAELEEGEPRFAGFDAAIVRATSLLEGAVEPTFPEVRHIIVDEVQDVVGVRAHFVLALLAHAFEEGVGFTLLGDPMQSLFDFQIDADDAMSAESFLGAVREWFDVETICLTGEYRSRSPEARAASMARQALDGVSPADQLFRLLDLCANLAPLGELNEDAVDDIAVWQGTTALLCDTNARAALAAARFAALGLPTELAASVTDPSLAPWIGSLLSRSDSTTVSFEDFEECARRLRLTDIQDKWRALVRVSRSRRGLVLRDVQKGLTGRRYPSNLLRKPSTRVIASTVHRAKGREFENIVLVDPDSWFTDSDDVGPAARRLFVALSRARSRVTRGRGISTKFWRKEPRDGVWRKTSPRGRGTLAVIMEPHHARHLGPVSQELSSALRAAVTWSRTDDIITADSEELPSWLASVEGHYVARTGEEFGRMIRRLSYSNRVPELSGGRVEGLETLVGPATGEGPGRHGLWVGARISGPVTFEWE